MMDKTIRRLTDPHGAGRDEQLRETYRYWQSRSVGERLIAVCELSESAYAFAAAFKGEPAHVGERPEGSPARVQRERR